MGLPTLPGEFYGSAWDIIADVAEVFKPSENLTTTQVAEQYLAKQNQQLTYYMHEAADCLTNRIHREVIFVGPARTGKTQSLIDNWVLHNILIDPADMKVYGPDEKFASWYSKKRIDIELMGEVPDMRRALRPGAHNDNVGDKIFRSGVILSFGWPSKAQLAGRDLVKVAFTDYDRGVQNVGGEGSQFTLGSKRTQTFFTRAKALAESSPSKPVLDPRWIPSTPHEAPPTTGILGLYNGGDRRRMYAPCQHCQEFFLVRPDIDAMWIPEEGSIQYKSENAALLCPHCHGKMNQDYEREFKQTGVWLKDGQTIDAMGTISGEGVESERASFWMPGWFAAFQSWKSIIQRYLVAYRYWEKTGSEEELMSAVNVDMGAAYLEMARRIEDDPVHALESRKVPRERYVVPEGTRCLLAAVDVQGGKRARFEVLVMGFGMHRRQWFVDRFSLTKSKRYDHDKEEFHRINPTSYLEDWNVLIDKVLRATYRLPNGDEMRILRMAVDTGGEAKGKGETVTDKAYDFWRKCRELGLRNRCFLVKGRGQGSTARQRVQKTYPEDGSSAKGEVPVYLLTTDPIKDAVWHDLMREEDGRGYTEIPQWLSEKYLQEICAETRTEKAWEQDGGHANETFDLLTYCRGMWIEMKGDDINWKAPPIWATDWEHNPEIITSQERRELKAQGTTQKGGKPAIIPRRSVRFRQKGD